MKWTILKVSIKMFMNRLNHSYGYNSPPSFLSQSHEQMTSLAGQFINFGLMGNTVSDMIRIIELDGENGVLRPKTIAFLSLLGTSLVCQLLFMIFTIWRFLYLRNRRDGDPDDDCCEVDHCHCCNCCRGTGEILFTLCFILTTVIMALQVVSSVVGAIGPIPRE